MNNLQIYHNVGSSYNDTKWESVKFYDFNENDKTYKVKTLISRGDSVYKKKEKRCDYDLMCEKIKNIQLPLVNEEQSDDWYLITLGEHECLTSNKEIVQDILDEFDFYNFTNSLVGFKQQTE